MRMLWRYNAGVDAYTPAFPAGPNNTINPKYHDSNPNLNPRVPSPIRYPNPTVQFEHPHPRILPVLDIRPQTQLLYPQAIAPSHD